MGGVVGEGDRGVGQRRGKGELHFSDALQDLHDVPDGLDDSGHDTANKSMLQHGWRA